MCGEKKRNTDHNSFLVCCFVKLSYFLFGWRTKYTKRFGKVRNETEESALGKRKRHVQSIKVANEQQASVIKKFSKIKYKKREFVLVFLFGISIQYRGT